MFLFVLSFYFGLPWRSHIFGIALGFGVFATVELRLRVSAMLATVVLHGRIVMPGARISVGRVTDACENLIQGLVRLAGLQGPTYASRVSAAI